MLFDKTDTYKYRAEFNSRFSNFCHKAPFLLSFALDEKEVKIIDETTSMVYSFDWDITMPVKKFIYHIKEALIDNGCYPIIIQTTREERDPTPEEIAEEMADGVPLEDTTLKVVTKIQKKYLIDKVIIFKDIFILRDLVTKELSQYKLDRKSVIFLRKLRTNKITAEEAGDIFFEEAQLIGNLNSKIEE